MSFQTTESTTSDSTETDESISSDSGPKSAERGSAGYDIAHWYDNRGYAFVSDGDEIVRLHRLVAYAEFGDALFDSDDCRHVHHELACFIHAPRWLDVVDPDEHGNVHASERECINGFPVLRREGKGTCASDEPSTQADNASDGHDG